MDFDSKYTTKFTFTKDGVVNVEASSSNFDNMNKWGEMKKGKC